MYFLHLTEASEQRRRLARSGHFVTNAGAGRPTEGFAVFTRLLAVVTIAFAAIAALAIVVG